MKISQKTTGFALAATAAAMLASAPMAASAGDKIHCVGINSCKGTSDCATATTSCKGQNACKGQGFLALTAEECSTKGGTIEG